MSEKQWRAVVKKGSKEYFRQWIMERYQGKVYEKGEITAKGREIKSISEEMLSGMRIFVSKTKSTSNRRGKVFEDEVSCTWDELENIRSGWDFTEEVT